MIVMHRFLSIS